MEAQPIRKRLRRCEVHGGTRFITFSCQGRLKLLSNPSIADLFVFSLVATRVEFKFALFAFVVMPEHIHLLLRPASGVALAPALGSLKQRVSEQVIDVWRQRAPSMLTRIDDGRGNPRFWQKGGGFDRNVRDLAEFSRHVRYIHRNPVERGLVESCEQWKWSSVRWWMGRREGEVECDPPPSGRIDWGAWKGYV